MWHFVWICSYLLADHGMLTKRLVSGPEGGAAAPPPRSGFTKRKMTIFRSKYGVECFILRL